MAEESASGPTKEELLDRAKELDIKGRSSMSAPELEAAISNAEGSAEPVFTRERLLSSEEGEALTGYAPHVVAGALASVPGDGPLPPTAVKQAVKDFLDREISPEEE